MNGAGGTDGGIGKFVLGVLMFIIGLYLMLDSIQVYNNFSLSYSFQFGPMSLTSGFLLIPFMIGVGMIFYNHKNFIGWILAVGAVGLIIVGVITSVHFVLRQMKSWELLLILVLLVGGIGLFLNSLKKQ
jgi:hypothetical protein